MNTITLTSRARMAADWALKRQPLWRRRNYLTLWGGKLVSATGSQMTQIAFPLLVLALTQSAAIAGWRARCGCCRICCSRCPPGRWRIAGIAAA